MKNLLKGWRTILFNGLMAFAMIYTLISGGDAPYNEEQVNMILQSLAEVIAFVWMLGNFVLRWITTTRIGHKE